MSFLRELGRRRVPQFVALYLASSWGLIEFVDWAVGRYLLSDHLVDAFVLLLVAFLPAAILLAFHHGQPGRNRWTRTVTVALCVNVIAALAVVGNQLHGKPLGRAATLVAVDADPESSPGNFSRLVPSAAFRTPVIIFFWSRDRGPSGADTVDADAADPDAWLRHGMPILLAADLGQDRFIRAHTPFSSSIQSRLTNAALDDPFDVPLAFARQLARSYGFRFLVVGDVRREGASLVGVARIFSVKPSRRVAEVTARAPDALLLTDRLTEAIKPHLDLHPASARLGDDLPIAERLSSSIEAVKAYSDAIRDRAVEQSPAAVVPGLERALEHDSEFARAHLMVGQARYLMGDPVGSARAAKRAIELDYALDLDDAFQARVLVAYNEQRIDDVVRIFEQWVELYPDDTRALTGLALVYTTHRDRKPEALELLERAIVADPTIHFDIMPQMAKILASLGRADEAAARVEALIAEEPERHDGWHILSQLYLASSRFGRAREALERAEIMTPNDVEPTLTLAFVDLAEGEIESARRRIDDAHTRADTPQEHWLAGRMTLTLLEQTGQTSEAVAMIEGDAARAKAFFMGPLIAALFELDVLPILAEAGRDDLIESTVGSLESMLPPHLLGALSMGRLEVAIRRDDADSVARFLPEVESFLNAQQASHATFAPIRARAKLDELEGDFESAAERYLEAFDHQAASIVAVFDPRIGAFLLEDAARCARRSGDLERAETLLTRALDRWPAGPKILVERARLAIDRDRPDAARAWLDRALEVWRDAEPDYRPAAEALDLKATL